jgi:polyisoprenoid-binding protein YceI
LSIAFLVRNIGYADVLGQFLKAEGSFVFDEEVRTVSDIRVSIDAASVFSNHRVTSMSANRNSWMPHSFRPSSSSAPERRQSARIPAR